MSHWLKHPLNFFQNSEFGYVSQFLFVRVFLIRNNQSYIFVCYQTVHMSYVEKDTLSKDTSPLLRSHLIHTRRVFYTIVICSCSLSIVFVSFLGKVSGGDTYSVCVYFFFLIFVRIHIRHLYQRCVLNDNTYIYTIKNRKRISTHEVLI